MTKLTNEIYNTSDMSEILKRNGFDWLTGEACAFSMRILFDVDEKGARIWREFMGLPGNSPLAYKRNRGEGSIMISSRTREDLVIFCLLMEGNIVWELKNRDGRGYRLMYTLQGGDGHEKLRQLWNHPEEIADDDPYRFYKNVVSQHQYSKMNHPGRGSRNQHMMSGRII